MVGVDQVYVESALLISVIQLLYRLVSEGVLDGDDLVLNISLSIKGYMT